MVAANAVLLVVVVSTAFAVALAAELDETTLAAFAAA